MLRRLVSAVLMMTLLLALCGCSGQSADEKTALALRTALTEAAGCRMTLEVHADCDGRIYTFGLGYEDRAGEKRIEVLHPDTIAGVAARVDEAALQLEFEDVVLDFGMPEGALSTPLMVPYLLDTCLKSAYIAYTSDSDAGTVVRYYHGYEDDRLDVQVVIDRASLTPKTCEVFWDGRVILSAEITEFELIDT